MHLQTQVLLLLLLLMVLIAGADDGFLGCIVCGLTLLGLVPTPESFLFPRIPIHSSSWVCLAAHVNPHMLHTAGCGSTASCHVYGCDVSVEVHLQWSHVWCRWISWTRSSASAVRIRWTCLDAWR